MNVYQTVLFRQNILHNPDGTGIRPCAAFEVGPHSGQFLVEQDHTSDSGWKLVDRVDRPIEPLELHARYGIWKDQPQPTRQGTVASLLHAMGAYPTSGPDCRIQANEVTRFPEPDKPGPIGWGFATAWSSNRINVAAGAFPMLEETGEAHCVGVPF